MAPRGSVLCSSDLRRGVAYFGSREKLYNSVDDTEIAGLPVNWRRLLCTSYPSFVVGPMGCIYRDIDHALAAFRVHYSTSNPCLSFLWRHENTKFQSNYVCKEWSTNNSLSMLMASPDDRVWFVVRDRCMFDLVFQRIARDDQYRHVLKTLVEQRILPVYHVRTAYSQTYWGGIINKAKLNLTTSTADENRAASLSMLADVSVQALNLDPSNLILGRNRLGLIMKHAMQTYTQIYDVGMLLRADVFNLPGKRRKQKDAASENEEGQDDSSVDGDDMHAKLPAFELTPLALAPPTESSEAPTVPCKRTRKPRDPEKPKRKRRKSTVQVDTGGLALQDGAGGVSLDAAQGPGTELDVDRIIDDLITPPTSQEHLEILARCCIERSMS